jgi:DNA-binding transcriptional regulator YhcF (GntR family)
MSLDATVWAWNQQVKSTQKLVLLSLADRAGENHDCWPSIDRLVENTGLNRKTVIKVIKEMVDLGLIHSQKKAFGRSNTYTLIGVSEHTRSSHKVSQGINSPKKGTNANSPKNGTPIVPESEPLKVPKKGHESIKESIKESKKEKKIKKENLIDDFKEEEKEVIQILIDHREEIKAPLPSVRAARMLLKCLNHYAQEWDITFNDALDYWLSKEWQSIDVSYEYPFRSRDRSNDNKPQKGTVAAMNPLQQSRINQGNKQLEKVANYE